MNRTPSILIIDDDDDIRNAMVELLSEEGYRVLFARNGLEALALLRNGEFAPGLILLDMMMPVMDGTQFRSEQLKDPTLAAIPVVLVTADARPFEKLKELGAQGCLRKPIELEDLFKIARTFCGSPVAEAL